MTRQELLESYRQDLNTSEDDELRAWVDGLSAPTEEAPDTLTSPQGWEAWKAKFTEDATASKSLEDQTPLTLETAGQVVSGVTTAVKNQFKKTPGEFLQDVQQAPLTLGRDAVSSFMSTMNTWAHDPIEALPTAMEATAGIGSLFTPAAPFSPAIALGARVIGEGIVGYVKDLNPFTLENLAEALWGNFRFGLSAGVATGAVKGALRAQVAAPVKTGVLGKVAHMLDLNKLSLPLERKLADTAVKPIEAHISNQQMETLGMIDGLNKEAERQSREQFFNVMPTHDIKNALEDILAVKDQDPALLKQVSEEVGRRARYGKYMQDVENQFDLQAYAGRSALTDNECSVAQCITDEG